MDDDVAVVHKHPVRVGEALTGPTPGPGAMHRLVDRVDDGVDVTVVQAGGQQEDVGQTESLGDVDGYKVLSLPTGRGTSGGGSQTDGIFGGGHGSPSGRVSQASCSSGDCTVHASVIRADGSTAPSQRWHSSRWR